MKFTLFTPSRHLPDVECDSVKLHIADSVHGRFSGLYGIKKGHAKTVFSLAQGRITASLNGQEVFSAVCQSGFATVDKDVVTVVVDGIDEDGQ